MRRFVLDTHACVFALTAPKRLGAKARAAVRLAEEGRAEVVIPAIVVAEILMLRGLGRLGIGLPELRAAMESSPAFRVAPLDLPQLDEFAALGAIRDPFDRLIVAAARALDASLVTKDAAIAETGLVGVVWS